MDHERLKKLGQIAPATNTYLKIQVLWPEMVFVLAALNEFLIKTAEKLVKTRYRYNLFCDPAVAWNNDIANVRKFQAAVFVAMEQVIPEVTAKRIAKISGNMLSDFSNYRTQFLDLQNDRYVRMTLERRRKNFLNTARKIIERDATYWDLHRHIETEAIAHGCQPDDLRLELDFPSEIEW